LNYLKVVNPLVVNGSSKNGSIDKYKARLVIRGFNQKKGLDHFILL